MLITFAVTLAGFTIMWLISLQQRNVAVIDCYWAFGFLVVALTYLGLSGIPDGIITTPFAIAMILLAVWSVRLGTYLVLRHVRSGKEDERYSAMRAAGGPNFRIMSLFKIFWLQAVILWLVAAPIHVLFHSAFDLQMNLFAIISAVVAAIGIAVEAIADLQLARGRKNLGPNRTVSSGLWAWSRHPNYFGELIFWWGFATYIALLTGNWIVLVGPLLLTMAIRYISVPLTEQHLKSAKTDYDRYMAVTGRLWPIVGQVPGGRKAATQQTR